jgi:hypothetical protein
VPTSPGVWGVAARALVAPRGVLLTVVNERPEPTVRRLNAGKGAFDVPVAALGARLVMIERATGRIVAQTPGDPVTPVR